MKTLYQVVYIFIWNVFVFLGGGILIGQNIIDDDRRGPWQGLILSMFVVSSWGGEGDKSGKEYEELLTKQGFVDVQYRQSPVLFLPGGVFARKP